ncbi:MAG: hypothetical protein DBW73_05430 [Flavobacteriales bacterium]|nr:MAG: hypothetical protein DBW73_05430 [Flavobacteriales bacterium]|tara:strand:- start:1064 stop:1345 length:282 start_codon:yes stop_codon:yes gene_type:complete
MREAQQGQTRMRKEAVRLPNDVQQCPTIIKRQLEPLRVATTQTVILLVTILVIKVRPHHPPTIIEVQPRAGQQIPQGAVVLQEVVIHQEGDNL